MTTHGRFVDCRLAKFLRRLGAVIAASATVLIGVATPVNLDTQTVPDDVKQAIKRLPTAQVSVLGKDHVPTFIQGYLGWIDGVPDGAKVRAALPDILAAFRLKGDELKLVRSEMDQLGMSHYHFDQVMNGLPVAGVSFAVHVDNKSGRICSANGNARSVEITREPKIDQLTAEKKALEATKDAKVIGETTLMYVVSTEDGSLHLAFRVELVGIGVLLHDFVFIDALDGSFVTRHPQIYDVRNRETYDANHCPWEWYYYYTSIQWTVVRGEYDNEIGDYTLDTTHDNVGYTYDYFSYAFGRDSIDNAGMTIATYVHMDNNFNNACWSRGLFSQGPYIAFGDGDNYYYAPFGRALDVVAHEYTHGVTQNTSNLTYQNESGALNEAMSDILGAMCEANYFGVSPNTWKIGEDIWTPGTAGDAMRYMDSPTLDDDSMHHAFYGPYDDPEFYSRDWYPSRFTGYKDHGGVHFNSGIANLAFKLLVTGGTHPRNMSSVNVPGIGAGDAEQIFYHANVDYADPGTDFAGFRACTVAAAPSNEQHSVHAAWVAVGVGTTIMPNASVAPLQSPFGQYVTLTQAGEAGEGIAWTENVIWQPNSQPDVLGNKGLGSITYMPHAGPGTYWYQFRLVDNYYNYEDQWISFTVEAPTGEYLIPATWVSPAIPISYGNSVTLYPYGMASAGVAWTENVIWEPNGQPVVLGNLGVGGAWSYTPIAGPGLYWYQFRLVDNNINYVDQWLNFLVVP